MKTKRKLTISFGKKHNRLRMLEMAIQGLQILWLSWGPSPENLPKAWNIFPSHENPDLEKSRG